MSCEHERKILCPDKPFLCVPSPFLLPVLAQSDKFRNKVYKNINLLFDFAETAATAWFRSARWFFLFNSTAFLHRSLKSRKINYSVVITWILYHLSVEKHVESSTSCIFIFCFWCNIGHMFSVELSPMHTYIGKKTCLCSQTISTSIAPFCIHITRGIQTSFEKKHHHYLLEKSCLFLYWVLTRFVFFATSADSL